MPDEEVFMMTSQPERLLQALGHYLHTPLDVLLAQESPQDLERRVLSFFQTVVESVPAYREFLHQQGIAPATIQSLADFATLPYINKRNYVQHYSLGKRCRHGILEACDFVAVSSGSTGVPTIWPRFISDELVIATRFEQVFRDSFAADTRRTLAVVCFALGTWVGGMYTTSCLRHLAAKGYPLTIVTPGNNKAEIMRVIGELGLHYEQVVLLGYPPFLKDVIDTGRAQGVDWPQYHIKMVMAGEVFSEEWRSLVGERAGMQQVCYDSASLYGTADAGVLANETPLSIAIRRFLAERPALARELFGESRLPTLCQYDPNVRYFEADGRALIFSGDNGVPLVRYAILDTGGVFSYEELLTQLRRHGFDPEQQLGSASRGIRELPFVYVFGRSDFTVSFFGANIYPENIAIGLERPEIKEWVTGKFVLEVREDADRNKILAVVIELAPHEAASAERTQLAADAIRRELLRINSEFGAYVPVQAQQPLIELLPTADPHWFPVGVKHRYTRR
jgi:phenylacetate-CoA ligase